MTVPVPMNTTGCEGGYIHSNVNRRFLQGCVAAGTNLAQQPPSHARIAMLH
jgi:hypothetical protein